MARLSKLQLFNVFEEAIHESEWEFFHLSQPEDHPARYQVCRDRRSHRVCVYIWNLTPGGRNRPRDEWRIQITGVNRFLPEPGGKTLILGWQQGLSVFAGFDLARHRAGLGLSPSIQLRENVLHQAVKDGFALHNKGNQELAIAFRPDFLVSYIENLESLHECGQVAAEIEMLNQIARSPAGVEDEEVEKEIAEPRRHALISTKRALREVDFRRRVLLAYCQRCAMCGVQLRLLDGAHILPVAHPDSTDGTDNGVALCASHHRAFDRAFVTFDPHFSIHVNPNKVKEFKAGNLAGGLNEFKSALRSSLILPRHRRDRPAKGFVEKANAARGWTL